MELKARWHDFVESVRQSYWFVPALLALAGFLAGPLLVWSDAIFGDAWLGRFEWFYGSRPEGARALLSTVAGSTITVAGVVFSITLAAVTYASGQYGPRLLSNFVKDRGNQVTLGVFIGTFLYCLVVLRTIRSAEEASAETAGAVREAFVPNLALFGALALAIGSIAVLIYFVHHVTDTIHINNVIARIGCGLLGDIEERSSTICDKGSGDCSSAPDVPPGLPVPATRTGYVEALDEGALVELAAARDAVLTVLVQPGDFVHSGRPLLLANCAALEAIKDSAELFSIGRKRSERQDLRFALNELVELAARALSPGVNDPFTAFACIDWLGAALEDISRMPPQPRHLCDADGRYRVTMPRLTFAHYLEVGIGQLRPYAAKDPNAAAHLEQMLHDLRDRCGAAEHRALIEVHRVRLNEARRQTEDA